MSTAATRRYTIRDSATMLRRNLRHIRRYPSLSIMLVAQPLVFLLLFVYVFGGTLGAGLPGHHGSDEPHPPQVEGPSRRSGTAGTPSSRPMDRHPA